jgi:hypothetical protein
METLLYGLAAPRITDADLSHYISKKRLLALQRRIQPERSTLLTEDKSVFYLYCIALGIPVPRFYALYQSVLGWAADGAAVGGLKGWEAYFSDRAPEEFLIKPAVGAYGRSVEAFRREGKSFVSEDGTRRSAAELCELLDSNPWYNRFVVQERLRSHPELERLSGCRTLQTVRIHTVVSADGEVELHQPALKVASGRGPTDNFDEGRKGNLLANVNPTDGRVGPALGRVEEGPALALTSRHPVTGARIEGFQVPCWEELCRLVYRVARLFVPLRAVGWDVGVTDRGPVLVEGNAWFDPMNPLEAPAPGCQPGMGAFLRSLRALAERAPETR